MSSFIQKLRDLWGLDIREDTELEVYLKKYYKIIPNIAYEQKRKIKELSYPVFINELITPDAWMVKNLTRGLPLSSERFRRISSFGNVLARELTWTDDKNLDKSGDYYLYPAETLTLKNADCEDHSLVFTSMLPEDLGSAWGFRDDGDGKYGHAFNVAIIDGELWCFDTVGNSVESERYSANSKFHIHYIITPKYTFQLRSGTQFGTIAGWR